MTIDIITFSDTQFALLSAEQIERVQNAQIRKDNWEREMEQRLQREKHRLVKNGIFNSQRYTLLQQKLQEKYQERVDGLRETLLFYLRYTIRPGEIITTPTTAPYPLDYALSYSDRLAVVRGYYENTYSEPQERFNAFVEDMVAPHYIGEFYKGLYDYFFAQI